MATAGFQAINDAGTFSVTDKNPTLCFITKGSVTCPGWGSPTGLTGLGSGVVITPPSGYTEMVMAYRSNGLFISAEAAAMVNPGQQFKVFGPSTTTVEWFLFARSLNTPSSHGSGAGLQIFDALGRNTFDSSAKPGKVMEVVNLPLPVQGPGNQVLYNGAAFPTGKTYAAVPRYYSERIYQPMPPISEVKYYTACMRCSTNLLVQEYMYIRGISDTMDQGRWGGGAILLVDVTGY